MRNSLRRIVMSVLCGVALLQARPAAGQTPDDSVHADIEKLMQITGSAQLGTQFANTVLGQFLDGMKQSRPNVPDRVLAITREVIVNELAKGFSQGMMSDIAVVYEKHFTPDDIRAMLAFYESPLGRKMIQAMPVVLQESMAIGQRWAETEMPRITSVLQERLRAEGFIK